MKPLPDLLLDLTPLLSGWKAVDDPPGLLLAGAPDYQMYLHLRQGRLVVTGKYPHGFVPSAPAQITVDPKRPVAVIVGEIIRRFLPTYLAQARAAWQECRAWETGQRLRDQQMQALAAILGTPPRTYGGDPWIDWASTAAQATLTGRGADNFAWKLSLPFELSRRLCAVLQAWADEQTLPQRPAGE